MLPDGWDLRVQSAQVTPWIAVNPNADRINVAAQRGTCGSVLEHYKALIRLRHHLPVVAHGNFSMLDGFSTGVVAFVRKYEDTELLVRTVLQHCPQGENVEIADLGTGSGAIALAIARERPRAHVLALDWSAAALDVARSNAERLRIGNVKFVCSDWFATLTDRHFDVIVSNPPYIAFGDAHLTQGDLRFEPAAVNYFLLSANCEANHLDDNVTCLLLGIGSEKTIAT